VTDGVRIAVDRTTTVIWAAAVAEPLVQSVIDGCDQAGLRVESLGPSGRWTSRRAGDVAVELMETWGPILSSLGEDAPHFAAACGAALAPQVLELLPRTERELRGREARRRLRRAVTIVAAIWVAAGAVYAGRLISAFARSTRVLVAIRPSVDSVLTLRRELDAGEATLATISSAEAARSRRLLLVADLTMALRDSTYLAALRVAGDGSVRVVGYAPSATRALADLEHVRELAGAKFEGPVTREQLLDRFSIVAQLVQRR
jgi:hypothetical protein